MTPLTSTQRDLLARLEQTVEQGLSTFVAVGCALLEIRDSRLYRQNHETFETYCRARWGMSGRHARRQIEAAQVATEIGPIGPKTESQARELAPLRDDDVALVETWRELREQHGERVTADKVRAAVKNRIRAKDRREGMKTRPAPRPLAGRFNVIYADPPWRYEHPVSGSRAIENQYPTMTLEEIKALPCPAADDAVLFLWATSPKLLASLEVMTAWGFEYRTSMVWVKDRIGMGYYVRQQHEFLLIGKRGKLPSPAPESRPASVLRAPRGRHSEKPERFYELIEIMYPGQPKLELFARATRPGWMAWGNELHPPEAESGSASKPGVGKPATGRNELVDVRDGEREPESDAKSTGRTTRRQNVVLSPRDDKPHLWKTRSYADASRADEAAERERQAKRTVERFERLELPGIDRPDLPKAAKKARR